MRKLLGLAIALTASSPALAAAGQGQGAELRHHRCDGRQAVRPQPQRELRKGPVVLYFCPRRSGLHAQARAFSEAKDDFRKAGAQVIDVVTICRPLKRFSVGSAATPFGRHRDRSVKAYDVAMPVVGTVTTMSNRTSYVIDRNGHLAFVHSKLDWSDAVQKTFPPHWGPSRPKMVNEFSCPATAFVARLEFLFTSATRSLRLSSLMMERRRNGREGEKCGIHD